MSGEGLRVVMTPWQAGLHDIPAPQDADGTICAGGSDCRRARVFLGSRSRDPVDRYQHRDIGRSLPENCDGKFPAPPSLQRYRGCSAISLSGMHQPATISPLYRGGIHPGLPNELPGSANGEPFPAGFAAEVPRLLVKILGHIVYKGVWRIAVRTGKMDGVLDLRPCYFWSWNVFHDSPNTHR